MKLFGSLVALCALPLLSLSLAHCGGGEATTQVPMASGGQGTDASAGASGEPSDSGAAGTSGQSGDAGQAGSSQGGAAGSSGQAGNAGSTAGSAGDAGSGGSSGNAMGGAAGAPPADAGSAVPCTTDAQCPGGSSCQITLNEAGTALELRCLPLAGANGNGYPCTDSSQCRSGLCLQGFCSNPCASSADCTQAGACLPQTLQIGSASGSFQVCVVAPCSSSSQCETGEVCSDIVSTTNTIDAFCQQKQATGGALGSACQGAADCLSQLCPTWVQVCTEVCAGDVDCAASPGAVCVDSYRAGSDYVQTCVPGCSAASQCPSGKACAISSDSAGDRYRFACEAPRGPDPTGADCSNTVECASGFCLTNYLNNQPVDSICTQPCVTSADCPAGFGNCVDVQMSTPSGNGKQFVRVCNHP